MTVGASGLYQPGSVVSRSVAYWRTWPNLVQLQERSVVKQTECACACDSVWYSFRMGTLLLPTARPTPLKANIYKICWTPKQLIEALVLGFVSIFTFLLISLAFHFSHWNHATGYASQHIWCLSQATINWEGCGRNGIRCKMGNERGGLLISPDGVAPSWIVGVSASDISPYTIKSRRRFLVALAHLGSPGLRALKRLCVCVCVCVFHFSRWGRCISICRFWLQSPSLVTFTAFGFISHQTWFVSWIISVSGCVQLRKAHTR